MVTVNFTTISGGATVASFFIARQAGSPFLATLLSVLVFAITLYQVAWLSYIRPYYVSELRHIPTVAGFPLWGQFFTVITKEVGVPQRQWHRQYGPIVRYFFPFGAERLSIADDQALKHITVKNPYNYPKPERARLWMARILGDGVLLAEGDDHAYQRKSLAPAFSIQSIRDLTPVFWSKALMLTKLWREDMQANDVTTKSFEVLEWLNRATLDIICAAGFGYEIDSLKNGEIPLRKAYRLCFAFDFWSHLMAGLQAFIPWTMKLPFRINQDVVLSRSIILGKATKIIKNKIDEDEKNIDGKDILALIVRDNKMGSENGVGLTFENMRDQVMTFLGAGHDTTATGVAWTLHLLSTREEMQSRLRKEIKEYLPFLFDKEERFSHKNIINADVDKLPFLENVCRESLRFIPPIPMTVRVTTEDDMLGKYKIPAGTVVYVIANAINHLPSFWGADAGEFDPDRWDNLPDTYTSNAYMTFLHGPRGCIGKKFAETEMKILICCLLSMYEFRRDYTTGNPEDRKMWRLVLRPKEGITVKVTAL